MKNCSICKQDFDETKERSEYAQAGEWLAGEVWQERSGRMPVSFARSAWRIGPDW